jgi:hypothetical protein
MRGVKNTPESFWDNVETGDPSDCWPYRGTVDKRHGYGTIRLDGKQKRAHRLAYEFTLGAIPPGCGIDHVCHNRDASCPGGMCSHRICCNPAHLEAVTDRINWSRSPNNPRHRTHCPRNHPYDEANTRYRATGRRGCRKCDYLRTKGYRLGKRGQECFA